MRGLLLFSLLAAMVMVDLSGPSAVGSLRQRIRIAGLFEEDGSPQNKLAFRAAVEAINRRSRALSGRDASSRPLLAPVEVTLKKRDSFGDRKKVCELMSEGVAGVIGPRQSASTDIVRSICDTLEVPQIVVNWDPNPHLPRSFQFNMHPDANIFSQALVDVVRELKWRSYTVLYESDESLVRLQGVLQAREPSDPPITLRQLSEDGDHRIILKEIKQSGDPRILLDCSWTSVTSILEQAAEIKLVGVYQSYLITSLDTHTVDLGQFKFSGTNITTLRLIQPGSHFVTERFDDFQYARDDAMDEFTANTITTEAALTYDAVHVLAEALFKASSARPIRQQALSCTGSGVWDHGISVREFMRDMRHEGLSGNIWFDEENRRGGFTLEVIEFSSAGFKRVGTWSQDASDHTEEGYTSSRNELQTDDENSNILQGRHIIVSSKLGPPYLKMKNTTATGNDRYEGYSMDLIAQIAELLNFTFEFKLSPDGEYGSYVPRTGAWNGIVGELMAGRADLGICDLTITQDRQSAVDFTMPFMNLGISILYKKSKKPDPNLFSFMDPFVIDVWIYTAAALMVVSLIFYVVARMAPGEWKSASPRDPDCAELENEFNIVNAFWLTGSALLGGGSELMPQATSTRILSCMWSFFKMIMLFTYTANMAAFLTNSRLESTINGVEDLAKQTRIKYGTFRTGSTAAFFRKSNDSMYARMWTVMKQARPDVFTANNDEGVERVKKERGNYAFFMESTTIEYQTALNCDLRKVGGLLDSKGYGIALPRDSPFRTAVSGAVLTLQERGSLIALKAKWWKAPEGQECPAEDENAASSDELGILNVGGVFLVLVFGTVGAFFAAILELLWNCRKIAVEEKITPWEAMKSEVKFVVQCGNDEKPVRKKADTAAEGQSEVRYGTLTGSK